MSYDPNRSEMSEFISAWNSSNQNLPYRVENSEADYNYTLNLNTVGEGDSTIVSNKITLAESGLYGFFTGDVRSNSDSSPSSQPWGDLYEIHFDTSDGDDSAGGNVQRTNRNDDQCYSISSTAELKVGYAYQIGGYTLSPWVRVLGVLIER